MSGTRDVKILMEGIRLGESPRWHNGRLWFADWIGEKLYALDELGQSEIIAEIASLPFCIDWLPDGRLLVVNARESRLMRSDAKDAFVTHADLSPLSTHPWNEIITAPSGDIYLNNIDYDYAGGQFKPGFVAVLTPNGTLRKVADGLAFPNGMAISLDGNTLIVAESFAQKLTAFDIAKDGSLTNRRIWAEIDGHPDGICIDAEGAIWTTAGSQCLRVREGGDVIDNVQTDRMCFSCALGGVDGRTLFMVAAQWDGAPPPAGAEPTGKVFTARVTVPAAHHVA